MKEILRQFKNNKISFTKHMLQYRIKIKSLKQKICRQLVLNKVSSNILKLQINQLKRTSKLKQKTLNLKKETESQNGLQQQLMKLDKENSVLRSSFNKITQTLEEGVQQQLSMNSQQQLQEIYQKLVKDKNSLQIENQIALLFQAMQIMAENNRLAVSQLEDTQKAIESIKSKQQIQEKKSQDALKENGELKNLINQYESKEKEREVKFEELEKALQQIQNDRQQQIEEQQQTISEQAITITNMQNDTINLQKAQEKLKQENQESAQKIEGIKGQYQEQIQKLTTNLQNTEAFYENRMEQQKIEFDNCQKQMQIELEQLKVQNNQNAKEKSSLQQQSQMLGQELQAQEKYKNKYYILKKEMKELKQEFDNYKNEFWAEIQSKFILSSQKFENHIEQITPSSENTSQQVIDISENDQQVTSQLSQIKRELSQKSSQKERNSQFQKKIVQQQEDIKQFQMQQQQFQQQIQQNLTSSQLSNKSSPTTLNTDPKGQTQHTPNQKLESQTFENIKEKYLSSLQQIQTQISMSKKN
eukprot:TRINITY_DN3612_c0_g1_i4.p1 TRINITY_DN3612_c0_g1~~TRINITY_DN3612_c0_g1_i4.p1  ORF type:complete len:530 (+),score=123.28 TRINITY_DN3612_c0_g1_i4:237-1826(+)